MNTTTYIYVVEHETSACLFQILQQKTLYKASYTYVIEYEYDVIDLCCRVEDVPYLCYRIRNKQAIVFCCYPICLPYPKTQHRITEIVFCSY